MASQGRSGSLFSRMRELPLLPELAHGEVVCTGCRTQGSLSGQLVPGGLASANRPCGQVVLSA